ncbi:hypothetical protein KAR91_39540, partial [Candidatus Pacearchaeota archaeon]|nr:hypothetical protein [Candidatus Pacearchaeota archaeon]
KISRVCFGYAHVGLISSCGYQLDKFEMWDGVPSGSDTTPPAGDLDITADSITVVSISSDCDTSNTILATSRYDTSGGILVGHDEATNISRAISTSEGNWYWAYWKAWDDTSNVTPYVDNEDSVYVPEAPVGGSGGVIDTLIFKKE